MGGPMDRMRMCTVTSGRLSYALNPGVKPQFIIQGEKVLGIVKRGCGAAGRHSSTVTAGNYGLECHLVSTCNVYIHITSHQVTKVNQHTQ